MAEQRKTKKFGIDARTHELIIGKWRMRLPQSRLLRITIGCGLIFGGILGFLPILGFWMVPLGLLLLAQDVSFLRRPTINVIYWVERKIKAWRSRPSR